MTGQDDALVNPLTGQRLVFKTSGAATGDELLEMESWYEPAGRPPGLHCHPRQREHFEVLEGTLRVIVDGRERDVGPGEALVIEPGMVHEMWNPGGGRTRVNWQVRPALKTRQLFETAYGLAREGKVNRRGIPNLLQVAVLLREYDDEFRLAAPPRVVQRALFGLLAPVARLLGYRGRYARYSGPDPARGDGEAARAGSG